jgi:hypothetical protein
MDEPINSSKHNPYNEFEINLKHLENIQNTVENLQTVKALAEKHKTLAEKCKTLPKLLFKSSCIILTLGIMFTWLIFTLASSKSSMYSKKWNGGALLAHNCFEIKKSCNATVVCDKYISCIKDNTDFKTDWLKSNTISYGDKVKNMLEGTTMYNSEGGAIYGSIVVYGFIAISLFLILLVVLYKMCFNKFFDY